MNLLKSIRIAASLSVYVCFAFACNRTETPALSKSAPISKAPVPAQQTDSDTNGAQDTAPEEFVITVREESYETFVDIQLPNTERPSLHWRQNSKQLFLTWAKEMPPDAQIEILRRMVKKLHERDGARVEGAALHLTLDRYQYPAYVERLARAAAEEDRHASTRQKGREDTHALHARIVRLTNEQHLTPELDAVFVSLDTRPVLTHVEKCSDARPGNRNDLEKILRDLGIKSTKRLPMGCLMSTFTLTRDPKP